MTSGKEKGGKCVLQRVLLAATAFLVLPVSFCLAAEVPQPGLHDSVKKRADREKTFLMRTSDDLGKSLQYVSETISMLKEQVDAARMNNRENAEREALLEWYQKYADWIDGISREQDLDLGSYFSEEQATTEWMARYEEIAKGYQKLGGQLSAALQKLEQEKKGIERRTGKLNTAILDRRIPVDKDDLELAKELRQTNRDRPHDQREAVYRDLSEEEVQRLRGELTDLTERQKYFEALMELERYEQGWLSAKAEDFAKLSEVARVIGGDAPAPIASACRSTIRTYEADVLSFKRKTGELDAKMKGMARTGTLGTLDRLEELSRYYEKMKARYERQIEWLIGQIGSYRADLVELGKQL